MKNLFNCHVKGLHSFPISCENGLYKRIFYAAENHELWKKDPLALAIHPHHVDIEIKVLEGLIVNRTFVEDLNGKPFQRFKWNSVILNGKGGFIKDGHNFLRTDSIDLLVENQSLTLHSCTLHTVFAPRGHKAVWMVEESSPSCGYIPVNYSNWNLEEWDQTGLYIEVSEDVKQALIGKYI